MRVVVATDARLFHRPDGTVAAGSPAESARFWAQYLEVFDELTVLARVAAARPHRRPGEPATGDGIDVAGLPDFAGLPGYLRALPTLRHRVRSDLMAGGRMADDGDTAYLARLPGFIGSTLVAALARRGIPYAVEVVGDAADAAASLAGPWAREPARSLLVRQCAGAAAVSYVTREVLQRRYPPPPGAPTASYSSGRLAPHDFADAPRPASLHPPAPARLLAVGSQHQRYKGHDVLIEAVAALRDRGRAVACMIVGDGRHHDELVAHALVRGLVREVIFVRSLDRQGVRAAMDAADLFVQPSRTEGLPRALLEAMAAGLPAVASRVGGVVELLAAADLVRPGDAAHLADRLGEVLGSPPRLAAMSERNLRVAGGYAGHLGRTSAQRFYTAVAEALNPCASL